MPTQAKTETDIWYNRKRSEESEMVEKEKIKAEIVERLKPLKPVKIILFGSYAYGMPTEESDIDLCVIHNGFTSRKEGRATIRKALKDLHIAKDIVLVDEEYFLSHSDEQWINTALYDARHKGEVLYG